VETLTAARDEAAKEIDAELAALRTKRGHAAEGVDAELLEHYDTVRERKRGLGVAQLSRRTCTGCNLDLTVIELEEAKETAKRGMPHCPQCDRLLVVQ
jgi:uncharacterized protein